MRVFARQWAVVGILLATPFQAQSIAPRRNDDDSSGPLPLGFSFDF